MKAKEIKEMSEEQIREKIGEWEEEIFNLRFQAKMGQLSNPLQLRYVRRDIARAKTVLNSNKN
ncbi:MAG: 50S ribosomal protein L29 [Chitinispirillaceae bacterium]|nr:50S ribosomal protein L29 [Chitinispirillaceae bacterium]